MRSRHLVGASALVVVITLTAWTATRGDDQLYHSIVDSIDNAKGSCVVNFKKGVFETETTGLPIVWEFSDKSFATIQVDYKNRKLGASSIKFGGSKGEDSVKLKLGKPVQFEGYLRSVTFDGSAVTIDSTIVPVATDPSIPPLKPVPDMKKPLITVKGDVSPIEEIVFASSNHDPALFIELGKDLKKPATAKAIPVNELMKGSKATFSEIRYTVTSQVLRGNIKALTLPIGTVPLTVSDIKFDFKLSDW